MTIREGYCSPCSSCSIFGVYVWVKLPIDHSLETSAGRVG